MKKNLLLFILLMLQNIAFCQTITGLDPVFGNHGIYLGDTFGTYNRVMVQYGEKIIGTGLFNGDGSGLTSYALRLDEAGGLDPAFGTSGYYKSLLPYYGVSGFSAAALQSDGKILLGGGTENDLLLIRLKPNGTVDNSFGASGIKIISFPYRAYITSIATQSDEKIVSAGYRRTPEDAIHLVRYKNNGSLDTTFGTNGEVYFDWSWGYFDYPTTNDVAVLPDGRIVVGATTKINANGNYCFTALRLLQDGSPDTSFNHSGLAYVNLGGWLSYCKAMKVQPDGKILLVGHTDSITVVRFDTTGVLDNNFGNNGIVRLEPGSGNAIALQTDGKILIGGEADTSFALFRLLPDGNLDAGFGINGSIKHKILSRQNVINGLAVQADGKILACGKTNNYTAVIYARAVMMRFAQDASGVEEMSIGKNAFSIFPNPVSDQLTIAYQNGMEVIANVTVTDITGRTLISRKDQQFGNSTVEIGTRELAPGVYFLSITNSKGLNQQFKFVKK